MTPGDVLLALLVVALWGFNFVAAKLGLQEFPPLFLMFLRFTAVAALLVPWARVPRDKLGGIAVFSVILGSVHFPLMFIGIMGIDAATASVVAQLQVPFSSLLAAALFGDRLGARGTLGMAVAFGGVVLIAGEPRLGDNLGSLLMVVGAAFAFATASMQIKRLGAVDGFALNGWMGLFAAPQLLVLSFLLETEQWRAATEAGWIGWGALAYIVLAATIVAYGLWYRLLRVYDVNQVVPFMLLIPVFAVLSSVLVLGETLTWPLVVGGLMTIAGVGLIVLKRPRTVSEKATNPT